MGIRRARAESETRELLLRVARELAVRHLDGAAEAVLGLLGESLGADRCFLAVVARDSRRIRVAHEWCRTGVHRVERGNQPEPVERYPLLVDGPLRGRPLLVEDVSDLPPQADAERALLEARSARSAVMVPVGADPGPDGVLAVATVTTARRWSQLEVDRLSRVGELIAACWPRQQEEDELRRLAQAVEQSPVGVVITDPNGVIEYVNPKFSDTSGYTAEEILGSTTRVLRSGQTPPHVYEELWRTVRAGNEWRGELSNRRKTGEVYWEAVSVSAVRAPDGSITHCIGVHEDISERRRARAELEEAKNEADRANRAKSDFLANISHEIRTPVNAIVGMSHLMLTTGLTDRQRDYLTKVRTSAQALLNTLNAILDFSQIEAGRMAIDSVRFELADVVTEVAELVGPRARDKGLEFQVAQEETDLGPLIGDPHRLARVVTTLADNAVKFTERGTVRVSARGIPVGRDVVRLVFAVRDTGIGLSQAEVERLFQPFTQADASTTRSFGGTGLGLAIARRLVDLMGGSIDISSEPGQGSEFTVSVEVQRAVPSTAKPHPAPAAIGGVRILLVDDSRTDRRVLSETLARFAFEVESVDSGEAALARLAAVEGDEGRRFDLVLVDWRMPSMDGLETCRRIKHDASAHRPPSVILITGHGREPAEEHIEEGLLDGFLLKPVNPSLLFDAVMAAVGRGTRGAPPPEASAGRRPRVTFPGTRVLVVEDNAINQEVAQALLDDFGVEVVLAGNGREAVEVTSGTPLDLVLMDIQMPLMDGYRATSEIRALPGGEKVPIIAMTAHAAAGDRDRCLRAGMDDYISKPIDTTQLAGVLRRWLGEGEVARPSGPGPTRGAGLGLPAELIDETAALRRLGGDEQLLRRLLLEFHADYQGVCDQLAEALEHGETEVLSRRVHTLKGVTSTLGLTAAHRVVVQLEAAVESGEAEATAGLVASLRGALDPIHQALAELAEASRSQAPAPPTDGGDQPAGDLTAAVSRLLRLLHSGDVEARRDLEKIAPLLRSAGAGDLLRTLSEHVRGYDFDEAASTLTRIAAGLGVQLEDET